MSGRIYRLRRIYGNRACGNRVNRFSYTMYNELAGNLKSTNHVGGQQNSRMVFKKNPSSYKSIVKDILEERGYTVKKIDRAANDLYVYFDSAGQASSANTNILSKMIGDSINPDTINLADGGVRTAKNLSFHVDIIADKNDPENRKPADTPLNQNGSDSGGESGGDNPDNTILTNGTGSSWTTWALIGGGVLLIVIIVALFLKKKK